MPVRYRDLIAWQKAMELVRLVYQVTKKFPKEELFALTLQIRKAVVSVPSNIAEGQGRKSTKEFRRHLSIAYGSLMETETQTLVAEMQAYVTSSECNEVLGIAAEVGRLINGLDASLEQKLNRESLTTDHRLPTTVL
ncbi:MAG: four helix bundle protein [Pyrinomonadaceae bacterium]|nr:four helix bundle protein [Pyrinomonadaceae bacterium]